MAWSWMVGGSEWTSPSQKDPTPQPLESTWVGLHMVEVVQVVLDAIHVTTTVDMTVDTTEVAMIAMTTGTITGHTEGDLLHHTTEAHTGLAPDHDLILPVAIECCCQAHLLPKHREEMLSVMIDFRIDLLFSVW